MSGRAAQMPLNWQGMDVRLPVKHAMAAALKGCGLSREQVVDKINDLAAASGIHLRLTLSILEKWVAPSADNAIPYQLLPIFCRATESLEPIAALAAPLGVVLAGPREQRLIAIARADQETKRLRREKRRALEELEEMR